MATVSASLFYVRLGERGALHGAARGSRSDAYGGRDRRLTAPATSARIGARLGSESPRLAAKTRRTRTQAIGLAMSSLRLLDEECGLLQRQLPLSSFGTCRRQLELRSFRPGAKSDRLAGARLRLRRSSLRFEPERLCK